MAEMKSPNAHARENRNDTPRKRKTHIIKVRVTAEEKLRIAYACKELHLTQSELVRRVLYSVNVKHTVVVAQGGEDALAAIADLSAQCSKVGSNSSLILKKTKTKKSNRVLYMTKPLKEELLAWLDKMKQDEQNAPEKYSNCGQLFRLPDGLPIAPDVLTKWYLQWRAEHPEFEKIVFHGLRHSSATYQLLQSGGDFKSVQGNTGHATATVLMDTYAHTQDKPRLELAKKIEANFYTQDLTLATPQQPPESKQPAATKISGKEILEAIRLMDAEERRELTRALFA